MGLACVGGLDWGIGGSNTVVEVGGVLVRGIELVDGAREGSKAKLVRGGGASETHGFAVASVRSQM